MNFNRSDHLLHLARWHGFAEFWIGWIEYRQWEQRKENDEQKKIKDAEK